MFLKLFWVEREHWVIYRKDVENNFLDFVKGSLQEANVDITTQICNFKGFPRNVIEPVVTALKKKFGFKSNWTFAPETKISDILLRRVQEETVIYV